MLVSHHRKEFDSWDRALREDKLKPGQVAVLQEMVHDGQVKNVERAARLLDWQDMIIDPEEHLYGF